MTTISIKFGRSEEEDAVGRAILENEHQRAENEALKDLLSLISEEVSIETIESWTPEQRALVEKWAEKYWLKANDNNVRVPPKPDFLVGDDKELIEPPW